MNAQITASSLGSLRGKVTIVTGAAAGIGRAAAVMFADAGARLVLADRDTVALAATAASLKHDGVELLTVRCDIAHEQDVERMVGAAIDRFGRLDCAFNNAGVEAAPLAMPNVTENEWQRVININLTGTFHCIKHEIPAMLLGGGGAIVNMSSGLAFVAVPNQAPYTASKHGILGLTKTATLEYARQGIRINAVCPGIIATPMADRSMADSPGMEEALSAFQPIGRMGRPDEVAAVALFLLSDAASFVMGAAIAIDGGYLAN